MTGTRGAWFALIGGCVLSVVMHKSKPGIWAVGIFLLIVLGVSIVLWDQIVIEIERRQLSGRGQFGNIILRLCLAIGCLGMA